MDPYRNPYDRPWINEMDDGTHRGRAGGTRGEYRKAPEDIGAELAKERPEAAQRAETRPELAEHEPHSDRWRRIYGD